MTSKKGYPYCDHCGAALVRFQWVDGYMVGDREYWYTTCLNCDKGGIRFVPAPPGCQRCGHAYLRKNHPPEKARRYNYEACAMGVYPMVPRMPEALACHLFTWRKEPGEKIRIVEPDGAVSYGRLIL